MVDGEPVDVLVVFTCVYPCLLLKLHPDFWERIKKDEFRSALFFFSVFVSFDFFVFFELDFECFKTKIHLLCS